MSCVSLTGFPFLHALCYTFLLCIIKMKIHFFLSFVSLTILACKYSFEHVFLSNCLT